MPNGPGLTSEGVYRIEYATGVENELRRIKPYYRNQIMDSVDADLVHQPLRQTRRRKPLVGLVPPFEHVPPVWELRVGEYRVFYDVDVEGGRVIVRAIGRKPPHQSTEEVL